MDGVTDSMDMSLSKLRELVKDREAWPPGVQVDKESDIAERLTTRQVERTIRFVNSETCVIGNLMTAWFGLN